MATRSKDDHAPIGIQLYRTLEGTAGPDNGTYITVSNTSPYLRRYDWIPRDCKVTCSQLVRPLSALTVSVPLIPPVDDD